jgi:imidazolonepropionase
MLRIENIGCLVTMDDQVGEILDAAILLQGKNIVWCGKASEIPQHTAEIIIDAQAKLVTPGFIDCHSHLIFAGSRAHEFARRMRGESYAEIMAQGGGIISTVQATNLASDQALYDLAHTRAQKILAQGVTTLEVKSGYGLSAESELRILRIIKKLNQRQNLELHPTYLGAHVVPVLYKSNPRDYIKIVINQLEHIKAENLARDCDVFCEAGAFSLAQAHEILSAATQLGFGLRAHVQQLGHSDGVKLVKDLPIRSVSHADYLSITDIELLAQAQCVVEVLPFANLFLAQSQHPPVKALRDAGVCLAIATDFNPGSAMCDNLLLAARLALVHGGFSCKSALEAITCVAAQSLGYDDRGKIKAGLKADIIVSEFHSVDELFYDWSRDPIRTVIKNGVVV